MVIHDTEIAEREKLARDLIHHEDELINQRLTWMWAMQGLLATAVGLLWPYHWIPVLLLSTVGLLSCVSVGYNLHCSHRAINAIQKYYNDCLRPRMADDPHPFVGLLRKSVRFDFLQPWRFLPPVMSVMWIAMMFALYVSRNAK